MKRFLLGSLFFLMSFTIVFAGNTLSITSDEVGNDATDATIGIALENPNDVVSGIQLDIFDLPDVIDVSNIVVTDRTTGFTVSYDTLANGEVRIVLYDESGEGIEAGSGDVLEVTYNVEELENTIIDLELANVLVSNPNGSELVVDYLLPGNIFIGTYALISMGSGEGDAGEGGYKIDMSMKNTGVIGGFQMDLVCDPGVLYVDSVKTTTATDGFSVDFSEVGGAYRVVLYNGEIAVSDVDQKILEVYVSVDEFAISQEVMLGAENVLVSNPAAESIPSVVTGNFFSIVNGYLFVPENLSAFSGLDGKIPLTWEEPQAGGGAGDVSILLVDDDHSSLLDFTDVTPIFTAALDAAGYTDYTVIEVDVEGGDGPDLATLEAYSLVLWYTGEGWQGGQTLTANDEANLGAYIDGGGKLFLSGQDYLWDIYGSTTNFGAGSFPHDYLGLNSVTQDVWSLQDPIAELAIGQSGSAAEGMAFNLADIFTTAKDGLYIDQITSHNGVDFFSIDDAGICAVETDDVIFTTVSFGGLLDGDSPNTKSELLISIINTLSDKHRKEMAEMQKDKSEEYTSFSIYRSETTPVNIVAENLVETVGPNVLAYEDVSVTNSVTYYYVVTAQYDERESGPSNEAFATAVEWVDLYAGSAEGYAGDDVQIDVSLSNEETVVGGFQFLIRDIPDVITGVSVDATDRLSGGSWMLDGNEQADGSYLVVAADISGAGIPAGTGPIVNVTFSINNVIEPVDVVVNIEDIVISDLNANELPAEPHAGLLNVLVETQYLYIHGANANPGESADIAVELVNTTDISGFQFLIWDYPDNLVATGVSATDRIDGWTVTGKEQDDGSYLVIGFDMSGGTITAGEGDIVNITYEVGADVPTGPVELMIDEIILSDPDGEQLYPESIPGVFGIGNPAVVYTVLPAEVEVGGTGVLNVTVDNTETIAGFQFTILDSADVFTGSSVSSSLSGWTVSGNEDDGLYTVIGFSMTGATIDAGSQTTFEIELVVRADAELGDYPVIFSNTVASNPDGNNMWSAGVPGVFTVLEENLPPADFNLLLPANGTTENIAYDWLTDLDIYEFTWEESVDPNGDAVSYSVFFGSGDLEIPVGIPSDSDLDGDDLKLTIPVKTLLDQIVAAGIITLPINADLYWYVIASDGVSDNASEAFTLSLNIETGIDKQAEIPEEFEISQNFPNPFNPTTSISYGLPKECNVKVEIFNVLGQNIRTLVNEKQNAGVYTFTWNAKDMSGRRVKSGVYLYKITTSEFSKTMKMMLLK